MSGWDAVWFIAGFVSCLIWLHFAGREDDDGDDDLPFA